MRIICTLITVLAITASIGLASPEIQINIPEYTLRLVDNGQLIKTYAIAVGTPYEQTPVGLFQILDKQEYPTWYPGSNFTDRTPVPPGPDNPLGTRWMEFMPHYGIHGTNKGWDINYPVSGGCIRMQDAEAREIYDKIPLGTPVLVAYQTLSMVEKQDGLYVKILPDIYNKQTNTPEQLMRLFAAYADRYTLIKDAANLQLKAEGDTAAEIKIATLTKQSTVAIQPSRTKETTNAPLKPGSSQSSKGKK